MSSLTQITVPFHGAELFIIEHQGEPYTPMKPIVDGMGLDWGSQFVKLKQRFKSTIVEITMVAGDGKERAMTSLPVRKLFGWLMTISPNKVRPELRDMIIMYQNECDDVLWDYWEKGQAINQRKAISPEQQAELHAIIDQRAQGSRSIHMEMWARHNRHFKIAKYSQLLAVHFEDAKHYLQTMEIKAKPDALNSNPLNALDLLASDTTNKVMDYYWALHQEINRLKGNKPEYPDFDKETIVRAVVTRMVDATRMLLTISPSTGKPAIQFIPNDSWILNSENIAKIIGDPSGPNKELLPDIINAAVKRLSK